MRRNWLRSFVRQIHEFFALRDAERHVSTLAPHLESTRRYYDAGTLRLEAARDLTSANQQAATRVLYREGGVLLALAFLASRGWEPEGLSPEEVFRRFETELAEAGLVAPLEFKNAKPTLLSGDPLELDRLAIAQVSRTAAELQAATDWVATLVDLRSRRQVRIARFFRLAVATCLVAWLLVWAGVKVFSPKNYALDRPATSSSVALSTSPSEANDGSKNGRYGFHSGEEDMPWWMVDLGAPTSVGTIKVYGRGDCCYDQSIPLFLEVSDDGTTFRKIAERTEPFTLSSPWEIKPDGLLTRFIRLHTQRRSYLVLNEVEVYAPKGPKAK